MASMELQKLSIQQVNAMDYAEFISHFGCILEHGTAAAATVWECRPFQNSGGIVEAFLAFIRALGPEAQRGIIRCCPALSSKPPKGVSENSVRERKAGGLCDLTESEAAELDFLNCIYTRKFGFPFVMCASKNKKAGILRGLKVRLGNSLQEEMQNAFTELAVIANMRISDIVCDTHGVKSKL